MHGQVGRLRFVRYLRGSIFNPMDVCSWHFVRKIPRYVVLKSTPIKLKMISCNYVPTFFRARFLLGIYFEYQHMISIQFNYLKCSQKEHFKLREKREKLSLRSFSPIHSKVKANSMTKNETNPKKERKIIKAHNSKAKLETYYSQEMNGV